MKRIALSLAAITITVAPAIAQRIGTEASDRTRIVHLKTALNHLTVIEVGEAVIEVAAGSPTFKVEPTEADAATNLFIWTATQRLSYELEPPGAVSSMDFAVDQASAHKPEPARPTDTRSQIEASPSFIDLLLTGKPVRMLPSRQRASKPVEVWISDLYEREGRLLICYSVRNHSALPYNVDNPQVYLLDGVRSSQSLYGYINSQLGDEQIGKLKIKQETPIRVLDARLQSEQIAPGEEVAGVVAVQMASGSSPTVLRLDFPSLISARIDQNQTKQAEVAAFVVR